MRELYACTERRGVEYTKYNLGTYNTGDAREEGNCKRKRKVTAPQYPYVYSNLFSAQQKCRHS